MYRSRSAVRSGGLIALSVLVSVALYPRLPADVAIHFSATGTPDNYVAKPVGVALLPVVMVLTLVWAALLCGYAFRREGVSFG